MVQNKTRLSGISVKKFFIILSILMPSLVIQAAPKKISPPKSTPKPPEVADAELVEDDPSLSKEEEGFLNEEFSPPQEAPYTAEESSPTTSPVTSQPLEPYHPSSPSPAPTIRFEQTGLKKVTAKGEYIYKVEESPQSWATRFRMGPFAPPNLDNTLSSGDIISFSDIYGTSPNLMFMVDVEYQLLRKVGKLGLRLGTGFYTANGHGRFLKNPAKVSREKYTFFLAPNVLDAIYHFDYFRNQILVPYVFGGGYYFTFAETRDDNMPLRYGGALAANAGGGLALLVNSFDRQASNQLDAEYGINNIYLIGEYEQIVGLNSTFDFSNQLFTGGILIEF